jgi:hypothetical protein
VEAGYGVSIGGQTIEKKALKVMIHDNDGFRLRLDLGYKVTLLVQEEKYKTKKKKGR